MSPTTATEAFLDAIADPIIVIDSNMAVHSINTAATELFGYPATQLTGQDIECLVSTVQTGEHEQSIASYLMASDTGDTGRDWLIEARRRDGSIFVAQLTLTRCPIDDSVYSIANVKDLTEQRHQTTELMSYIQDLESAVAQSEKHAATVIDLLEELAAEKERLSRQNIEFREQKEELMRDLRDLEMTRSQFEKQATDMVTLAEQLHFEKEQVEESRRVIEHQANHDPLTNLGNRALLASVLPSMIAEARANGTKVGLINIDLDNFKAVNDRLGHEAGDDHLKAAAKALRANIRADDEAIRQGGDEFSVIARLNEARDESDLRDLAERIRSALTISVECPDRILETGASIGIALFPDDGLDTDSILTAADDAMYRAKRAGKGRVH